MKCELDPQYVKGVEIRPYKKGAQYEEALKATRHMNFSAGIWYFIYPMGDRFSSTQNLNNLTIEEGIEFLHRVGVKKVSFHYPGEYTDSNCDVIDGLLKERNMSVGSVAGNTFTALQFKWGGPCCHIKEVRDLAYRVNLRAQQINARTGANNHTDWAGRDGLDSYFLYEAEKQWEWTKEAYVKLLMAVEAKAGIAIEFKPYDAMEHLVLKNVDTAMLFAEEVEKEIAKKVWQQLKKEKGNKVTHADFDKRFRPYDHCVGVNIEDAHVYLAGQKVAEAVRKSIAAKRLFLRHENDCEGRIDNDLLFGSVHFWDALEATYVQIINKYDENDGWHEPDIFPQRDDQLKAYIQCLNAINFFYAMAGRIAEEKKWANRLKDVMECKYASEAGSFLFDLVSEGIEYPKIPLRLADDFRKEIGKPMKF